MDQLANLHGNPLSQLISTDPAIRSMAVETLMNDNLDENSVKAVCSLVSDTDKGVRNSVDLMLSTSSNPFVSKCLVQYISSNDISTRNLAGEILLKIGSNSVGPMTDALLVSNNDDKKFLIDILGLIGDIKSAPAILDILKNNFNDNVVMACIEALGNLNYSEALDTILLVYERNELYKPTIIEAIGKIGTPKALDFIFLKYNEEDELTKFSMIESLGLIGNEEAFFFLLSELNEIDGPLTWPAVESINSLKEKFELNVPYDERMKNMVLKTVDEAPEKYRKAAANLLTLFDGEDTLLSCLKIYGNDFETDEIIKPKILEKPSTFFEALISILNEDSANLKSLLELSLEIISIEEGAFKNYLTSIQLRNLTDTFTRCIDNPDEEIRKLTTEILFAFDQKIAILFLDKILEDENVWNKLRLLDILSTIDSSEAEQGIVKLSSDKEEMVSERARFILSQKSVA